MACFDICLQDHKSDFQERRWGPAWITYIVTRLLGGLKDTWESYAVSLGVIDKATKAHYSRIQRKKDLEGVRNLSAVFAAHDWSEAEDGK